MSHRYHPDPEKRDPQDAILYDDCTRCEQHSREPRSLDPNNLRAAWDLSMVDDWSGMTANQCELLDHLYGVRVLIERLKEAGITL